MNTMIGIADCDNFFVSCERRRHPELVGRPVVVLSAGSAAVIARSNEAKAMGVKMSMPYFLMKEQFGTERIIAIAGDHDYYKSVSAEVMNYLRNEVPQMWQYSIDEAFFDLTGMHIDLKKWGERLAEGVQKNVGVPVSIGMAPSKTLAKIASRFAKKHAAYNKCCLIDDDDKRIKALKLTPIDDVWGIGRRYRKQMHANGIHTAHDLVAHSRSWLMTFTSQSILETQDELRGISCIPFREEAPNKSVSNTRTFPKMIESQDELATEVANFAAACAHTLRSQHTLACDISVFVETNLHRPDLPQYSNSMSKSLPMPTNLSTQLIAESVGLLKSIYRTGFKYKRAGVTIHHIVSDNAVETNLLDFDAERHRKLSKLSVLADRLNSELGKRTVILGRQVRNDHDVNVAEAGNQPERDA